MGILATIKNKTTSVCTAASTAVGPHKTDICFGVGMLTLGFGIFALCKASTRLPEKTENLQKNINDIAEKEASGLIDTETAKQEINKTKVQAGCDIGKEYILGAACVVGGVVLIGKSYTDVRKDNIRLEQTAAGLALAYGKLQDFTNNYRARVIAEEGAEKDTHYAFGTTPIEVTNTVTNADGNQVEQKTVTQVMPNSDIEKDLGLICIYPSNPIWKNDPGLMLSFIRSRFNDAESALFCKKKISRNDILDLFVIDKDYSPEGMKPGYIWDKNISGKQIDWAVHYVSRDTEAKTKYIPMGAKDLENYIIIELKNLNPDITVPRYRFQ